MTLPDTLPDTLAQNLRHLAAAAADGAARYGAGVTVLEYAGGRPNQVVYLPEASVHAQLAEAPILEDLARQALDAHDPEREFIVLVISAEGDDPLCWIVDREQPEQRRQA